MTCNEASEHLAAAILGDLARDEQRAVHAHLAGCDRCIEEESELFASLSLLRAHGEVEPGAEFHDAMMARAAGATTGRGTPHSPSVRQMGVLTQTLLTAAATALIVVGLQAALESWRQGPALSAPYDTVYGAALSSPQERPTRSLLQGTLFDRQRNIPDNIRQRRQQVRRGDAPHPLDL